MTDDKNGVNWDLTSYFPEFNGPEMKEFKEKLKEDITWLQDKASDLAPLSDETAADWEEIILKTEDFDTRLEHIFSYVGCLSAADAANEDYSQGGFLRDLRSIPIA